MSHYHPVSYETEARIRQADKLDQAHRHRQVQTACAGREPSRPGISLFSRVRRAASAAVTVVKSLRPLTPERG